MIFVDTSFWIAEAMTCDGRHEEAVRLATSLASERVCTSNLVVGETWTFLRRRAGYRLAMRWLDAANGLRDLTLQRIDENLEAEAWMWLRIHDERPYSFVDATSVALMRRLRISDVLAFDGDFAAAGFNELRP